MSLESSEAEKSVLSFLPAKKELVRDILVQLVLACSLGPLLGPLVVSWINPVQAWGGAGIGDYSPGSVLLWGLAFMMFEALFYTGWLISRARRGWNERDSASAWWNQQ
jgi:hypothetical protein